MPCFVSDNRECLPPSSNYRPIWTAAECPNSCQVMAVPQGCQDNVHYGRLRERKTISQPSCLKLVLLYPCTQTCRVCWLFDPASSSLAALFKEFACKNAIRRAGTFVPTRSVGCEGFLQGAAETFTSRIGSRAAAVCFASVYTCSLSTGILSGSLLDTVLRGPSGGSHLMKP